MAWQPNPQGVNEIVELLRNSQSSDRAVQQNIQARLQTFNKVPEYCCYLAYVFGAMKNEDTYLRTVAGLILKNNLKVHFAHLSPEQQAFLRDVTISSIGDPDISVRNTAGSIISTAAYSFGLNAWPGLLQTLFNLLDNPDFNVVEGAFSALYKVCEECVQQLEKAEDRPLNILIPKFVSFFGSQSPGLRRYAISAVNLFLLDPPAALLANMDTFLEGIQRLASDPSLEVRKQVCHTFVTLIEVRRDTLMPRIGSIIEYMLQMTRQEEDEDLALAACEFWTAIAETSSCKAVLGPFLPALLDVLLDRMNYSEDELFGFELEKKDDEAPDQEKDIKPRFHKSKFSGGNEDTENEGDEEDEDDEDDEDEDDDDDDEQATEWTLRKCAASGLDVLSGVFREELLPALLEKLGPRMADGVAWPVRESAILAIGAVAEGCIAGMSAHLPQLLPYLVTQLSNSEPLVRSISCWTLSRYAKWVVRQPNADQYFRPMLQALLGCILDKSKRVQEAACSAFATLEEETREHLVPYLGVILQNLMFAFERYQAKNLLILYDAIGTLADSVGGELNRPEHIQVLLPPLIKRWNQTADSDKTLCPLLECLTAITIALGPGFEPFAPTVFTRCLRLVESGCMGKSMADQGMGEEPDPDFIVCSLDLISGMIEGLEVKMEQFIEKSNMMQILFQCVQYDNFDVRQSTFALLGDLSKSCFGQVREHLGQIIPILIQNLNLAHVAVCNNACWAIGEIAEKIGNAIGPFVSPIMTPLTGLIHTNNLHRGLLENIAITIGRLSGAAPDQIAPHLESFVASWCLGLRLLRDNEEKESAFRGLVKVVSKNPDGIVKHFVYLCEAIASWHQAPPRDLQESFYHILHGFKTSVGPQIWNQYFLAPQFPEHVRTNLQQTYGL